MGFCSGACALAGAFLQSRQVPTECGAPCALCSPVARSEWLRRFCQIQSRVLVVALAGLDDADHGGGAPTMDR